MLLALTAFHVAILFIAAAIFVAAAVNDICVYRIPNYMCALLIALFPIYVRTSPYGVDWKQNLMLFVLVVATGFAMFLGRLAGAGDIKLLAAASLWAGPHFIAVLLIVTALAGGVVSITMAALAFKRRSGTEEEARAIRKVPIPYGVAIAAGGLAMLAMIAQPILLPD